MQGRAPVKDALAQLATALDAEVIALGRISREGAGNRSVVVHDAGNKAPALERSFADVVLGPYFRQPRPGSVWFKSLTDIESDPRLETFHQRRRLNELAVIPLSVAEKSSIFLEIHFSSHRGSGQHALINMVAATLADTWSRRRPGLMTELLLARRSTSPSGETDLMSLENPARLSRAEFRVCLLLSRGLSNKRVCAELGISESTLRTHLRSIYAKCDCSNHSELLFRLLSPAPTPSPQARRVA
ncbi:helix-turn-helix transcriptional regulator [Roseibacterium sp. SDUM158016]|uniref:helix-turn-helix transcriptional regulator n=1 Tax=Roseicyclus sediminis TaxID=2980997 RepID=UPI0021CFF018|nr:helix-turn-helix transcriptional regulator [Roseibacterium sp. SDUM158016]MCU4654264.1 helix-turn-helix transcriptional regulator [Roseibacterium sp. SDUM158016]